MNTHNSLRYFLTKKKFITGYVQVRTYDFHCKMCNSNMFYCLCSALMEKHDFYCCHPLKLHMILYSTGIAAFHCSVFAWGLG